MAEGRMLKKKISLNEAVADLASDTHRLLFTWGISHLDVEGRITGSPRGFKAMVAPLLEHITPDVILGFFNDAQSHGLIQRYEVNGEWHTQYPKFGDNQNLTKSREAASKRPPLPPNYLPPGQRALSEDSGSGQSKKKLIKEKLREGKEKKVSLSPPPGGDASLMVKESLTPQELVELYNRICRTPLAKKPIALTPKRLGKAKLRLSFQSGTSYWQTVFEKVMDSPFLRGERGRWNGAKGADFDWLTKDDDNPNKVWEGKYDEDEETPPTPYVCQVEEEENLAGLLTPDPQCSICGGDGLAPDGPCKCLHRIEQEKKKYESSSETVAGGPIASD